MTTGDWIALVLLGWSVMIIPSGLFLIGLMKMNGELRDDEPNEDEL